QSNNDLLTPSFYHNWFYSRGLDKAAEAVLCLRRGHFLHQTALERITPYPIAQSIISYLTIYRAAPYQSLSSPGANRVVSKRPIGQVALGERRGFLAS
ncbi:hypothetical protein, partial [Thiolapillus sp.]|uniref:hypothetical protein n=1 Tax=Thiolapillus sp. TaxID=2017437 RepID=UPI003AF9B93D